VAASLTNAWSTITSSSQSSGRCRAAARSAFTIADSLIGNEHKILEQGKAAESRDRALIALYELYMSRDLQVDARLTSESTRAVFGVQTFTAQCLNVIQDSAASVEYYLRCRDTIHTQKIVYK
jgi:hypothetical protein